MSRLLYRLGHSSARHPWRVLGAWLLIAVVVLGLKGFVGGATTDNFTLPGTESQQAIDLLKARFPAQSGALGQIVFKSPNAAITSPNQAAAVESALAQVAKGEGVLGVSDPFDPKAPAVSPDGHVAIASVQYDAQQLKKVQFDQADAAANISRAAGVQTELNGTIATAGGATPDGKEGIGLAVAVVVLLVAFGSVIAMGIPIGTALFGILIGTAAISTLAGFVDVPTVSPMLATMIGLGVGIDYALFVVTRHRQHLHEGMTPADAAGRANATAGQAVLFAGTTVVIAIAGLKLAGIPAVAIMGFSAAIVVTIAMAAAVTLLPAFLGLAGTKIDKLSVPHRKAKAGAEPKQTLSGRWAHYVGKRPWRFAVGSLVALVALAAPVMAMRIGFADDGNAAAGKTERKAYDITSEAFGKGFNGPLQIVVRLPKGDPTAVLTSVRSAVAADPDVAFVAQPKLNPTGDTAVLAAIPKSSPEDSATSDLVSRLRSDILPTAVAHTGAHTLVAGHTASLTDVSDRLTSRLPIFIGAVVALSFLLLMIVFRSVLVPAKAALMNLLSIGAAYGVIVAMFQWGWGKGLLGIQDTVPVNPFVPMIMFAILFGLSMDYEVFLLSRVREEYLRTGDSHTSVVDGLTNTARVITSAALIMVSVFLAFVGANDVTIKMFGVGLATAVFIDATLVRMVLVPATMALLGGANWWLPRWLDRILPHLDLESEEGLPSYDDEPEPDGILEPVAA